ncbi:MAG: chromate transporter [Candidatus Lustribacter sp.]|jgi:chromate transporter
MDQLHTLLVLFEHFMVLSLFAVGGGPSMLLPQMRQEFVLQYHFLTDRSFTELLAVAQATPGPNFLIVPLIGFRAASWPGAIVSIVAFLVLPMTLTFFVGRLLHQHDNEWVARIRRGFRPATGGLWIVSGIVIAMATDHTVGALGITLGVAALSLIVDISPMWWCLIAGAAGAILA